MSNYGNDLACHFFTLHSGECNSPYTNQPIIVPIDELASLLKTTLANGVKVVKKVITSKFRFHLIAIYALATDLFPRVSYQLSSSSWSSGMFYIAVKEKIR
jgi:hypothetical protein